MPSNESYPHIDPSAEVQRTERGFLSKSEERRFDAMTEGMDPERVEALLDRRTKQFREWQESKDDESLDDFINRNNQSRSTPLT